MPAYGPLIRGRPRLNLGCSGFFPTPAFFFVPVGNGYLDLVRGDRMDLKGLYSKIASPASPTGIAWQLGNAAGTTNGWAQTHGGDTYYQTSPSAWTLMVAYYNPTTISGITQSNLARIDSVNPISGGGGDTTGVIDLRVTASGAQAGMYFGGGGSTASLVCNVIGGSGTNVAGELFFIAATYNGATEALYAQSNIPPNGSGYGIFSLITGSNVRTPGSLNTVYLGRPNAETSSEVCQRVILWCAGWWSALSQATIQTMFQNSTGQTSSASVGYAGDPLWIPRQVILPRRRLHIPR